MRAEQIQEIVEQVEATIERFNRDGVSNEILANIAFEEWVETFSDLELPNAAAEFERAFPRLAWSL